jgi:glycosyltransferase involved in cell wall biosynthesis
VKIIALLPVKNEAWVLEHTLACLSGFCDLVIVNDQQSDDNSRDIGRRFPKVVWIDAPESKICEQARWQLWDAARQYDGNNLIWCTDADELLSPPRIRAFFDRTLDTLTPGTVVDSLYCHVWQSPSRYRSGLGLYAPHRKVVAIVDDRRQDYDRSRELPLHEERVPIAAGAARIAIDDPPLLHLQWLLPHRSQMRQAWYRCREWMQQDRTAAAINDFYSRTLPEWRVPTAPIPASWLEGITLPGAGVDTQPAWQQFDILGWFDARGVEFFEPLEIWHVDLLRSEFRRRTGRSPRPDRSYREPWPVRAFSRRVFTAAKRVLTP